MQMRISPHTSDGAISNLRFGGRADMTIPSSSLSSVSKPRQQTQITAQVASIKDCVMICSLPSLDQSLITPLGLELIALKYEGHLLTTA
jgi:hypothetical protein